MLLFSVVSSKDALWRLWSCIVDHLSEHIQKVSSHNEHLNRMISTVHVFHDHVTYSAGD